MTHVLKTIIVDDEALARRGLKLRLSLRNDVDVIAEARNGREALALIREHEPDLVFLDIQMPGMDGFDVMRKLPAEAMPAVVFVTAFNDYAIKAFEANALDYLLKPIEDIGKNNRTSPCCLHGVSSPAANHFSRNGSRNR